MNYNYLFGPVMSRRLGVSLGVDIIPAKTCNLNCVYCECGKTNSHTIERKEYIAASSIISELDRFIAQQPKLDVITFSGSGEPTLNTALGEIIIHIKSLYTYKVALITNSSLLYMPDVRADVLACDYVLPSLDAVSGSVFKAINHPHTTLDNQVIIDGLIEFGKVYKGNLWLEIFIIPGVNDTQEELIKLKDAAQKITPSRVQLNSLDRPAAFAGVEPATSENLSRIARFFRPLPVEIISRNVPTTQATALSNDAIEQILSVIRRRPCTIEDLSVTTGQEIGIVQTILATLLSDKLVISQDVNNHTMYRLRSIGPFNGSPQ